MMPFKTSTACLLVLVAIGAQAAPPARLSGLQARHFLLCTGFAPDQAGVEALTGQSAMQAVSDVIRKAQLVSPLHAAPDFTAQPAPVSYRSGARAVSLNNPEAFVNQSRLAQGMDAFPARGNAALRYLQQVESDINQAAQGLRGDKFNFVTPFPAAAFGNGVKAAAQVVASQRGKGGVPVITLTLGSFDTHQNQLATYAGLLRQLAEGMAALRGSLSELGAWDRTQVMTFSEFGRRPHQNSSNGTDHGTLAPHFAAGGAVRGGLYGKPPDLTRLDGTQNASYTTDFRQLYATVAKDWWGVKPDAVTRGHFEAIAFLRS
ncbi:MAG: DUF1501 domain-containing protein [Polaromonas sp.]